MGNHTRLADVLNSCKRALDSSLIHTALINSCRTNDFMNYLIKRSFLVVKGQMEYLRCCPKIELRALHFVLLSNLTYQIFFE
jgi:hypothetical protein